MKKNIINACLMCIAGLAVYLCSYLYIANQTGTVNSELTNDIITEEDIDQESGNSSFIHPDNHLNQEEAEPWNPSPDDLNLAHFFPEGTDSDDITESYAGLAFQELMNAENAWWVNVYSNTDLTPRQLA